MTATLREVSTRDRSTKDAAVQSASQVRQASLVGAVQRYFDLMYDCDTSRFDDVFRSTAQLHGVREGQLICWPAATYKEILEKRQSPKALGAVRQEEILSMDFASNDMALVKVRVRIGAVVFADYLTWHCIDGKWLIVSKSFLVESSG